MLEVSTRAAVKPASLANESSLTTCAPWLRAGLHVLVVNTDNFK